jgi:hypothetical protein
VRFETHHPLHINTTNATVLKTAEPHGSGGSNPPPSATLKWLAHGLSGRFNVIYNLSQNADCIGCANEMQTGVNR